MLKTLTLKYLYFRTGNLWKWGEGEPNNGGIVSFKKNT